MHKRPQLPFCLTNESQFRMEATEISRVPERVRYTSQEGRVAAFGTVTLFLIGSGRPELVSVPDKGFCSDLTNLENMSTAPGDLLIHSPC